MSLATLRSRIPVLAFAVGIGLVLAVWLLRSALAPFFLAMVLAYLQVPLVELLSRRIPRGRAALLVVLGTLALLGLLLGLAIPFLLDQADRLVEGFPAWRQAMELRWKPWMDAHPWIVERVARAFGEPDATLLLKGALGAGSGALSFALQGMSFLLVPVLVYYFLAEGPEFLERLDGLVPPRHRPRIRATVAEIHLRLGGYIRGQIAVALVMAILQGLTFRLTGAPHPWLLGCVAGISNIVPYSPYGTALLPALALAGLTGATWGRMAVIAVLFTAVQKAEALYFTPVWVGRASRLHPLEVLLAILCFGFAFGLPGLVFAVPLMIIVKVLVSGLVQDYQAHPWFGGEEGA